MNSKIEKKILHYTGKAISIYNMIQNNDRVLVCLSGGKDSFVLVKILHLLQIRAKINFKLHILAIDKGITGWNRSEIESWLKKHNFDFTILKTNIFDVVKRKEKPKHSYCVLCSRLRRGYIYAFAKKIRL